MKILVLDAYFEPEQTAFTHLENDLLEAFVNSGHEVEIVCPTPSRGIDDATAKKYSGMKKESLCGGKVSVTRFYAPKEGKNSLLRALRYFWCNFRLYRTAKKIKDADVIFSNSTPPVQGLVAIKLKKKLKIPFIYDLQDIFPDSLSGAGLAKKGSLSYRIGDGIANKIYAAADRIIVISEDFKKNIIAKGVAEEKIKVVYNWVDTDSVRPVPREGNRLFDELDIDRDLFTVVYAGNFGKAQGVKVVFDAAKLLKERKDIRFVLFGGGAEYEDLKKYGEQNGIDNLSLFPLLGQDRVSEVYGLGSVNLITCKKGFGGSSLPSKTWSILACNSPVIASYDQNSELAEILEKSGAGVVIEPENAEALAKAIERAKVNEKKISAREFVVSNADKKVCVKKYVDVVEAAVGKVEK